MVFLCNCGHAARNLAELLRHRAASHPEARR